MFQHPKHEEVLTMSLAGATTIVTKRTTSSQPTYRLEVPIRRFNFLFILLESYPHLFKCHETNHSQAVHRIGTTEKR